MRILPILLGGLALVTTAFAQDDPKPLAGSETKELLQAQAVKHYLQLGLQEDAKGNLIIRYEIDAEEGLKGEHKMPNPLSILVKGHSFNLIFRYISPVNYAITTSETVSEDPSFKSITKFVESANALTTLVQGIQSPTVSSQTLKSASLRVAGTQAVSNSVSVSLNAPDLLEWALWYNVETNGLAECMKDPIKRGDFLKALDNADKNIYAPTFNTTVGKGVNLMNKQTATLDDLVKVLPELLAKADTLEAWNTRAEKAFQSVSAKLGALDWIAGDTSKPECDVFKPYTKGAISRFIESANGVLEARKKVVADYKSLLVQFQNITTRIAGNNSYWKREIELSPGELKEVTITVKRREVKMNDDGKITITEEDGVEGKLRVRKYTLVVPEFVVGVMYTNLEYPLFGTKEIKGAKPEDDKMVVDKAGVDKQELITASMLNVVFRTKSYSIIHPLLQLGVGTGGDRPLFLAGAGLRSFFPTSFVVTAGAVWTWTKELNDLSIGDEVTGTAQLEEDLSFKFRAKPRFYLGLQFSF